MMVVRIMQSRHRSVSAKTMYLSFLKVIGNINFFANADRQFSAIFDSKSSTDGCSGLKVAIGPPRTIGSACEILTVS